MVRSCDGRSNLYLQTNISYAHTNSFQIAFSKAIYKFTGLFVFKHQLHIAHPVVRRITVFRKKAQIDLRLSVLKFSFVPEFRSVNALH